MVSHTSSYDIDLASARQLRSQTWTFTLAPDLWDSFNLLQELNWWRIAFDETPARQIPNNLIGVYAFVLEPNVASLNLAYLLYVGKTTENFRARYRKYKTDQSDKEPKRHLVKQMLTTWPGRLAFYYAPVSNHDMVKSIEDELIATFKPPVCRSYPARVRGSFKILDTGP